MYQYEYIGCQINGVFVDKGSHRATIDKMASEGWRFVCFIPTDINSHGFIRGGDLVFERQVENET